MLQHVLEPRYKKAILELVGQLSSNKPRRINTMVFCQRHDVDNRFFEVLEGLGAIKNKGESGIDVYDYVRTGKLLGLNAADVLAKLSSGNVAPVAEPKPVTVKADKKAKPVIEFFDPADNVAMPEPVATVLLDRALDTAEVPGVLISSDAMQGPEAPEQEPINALDAADKMNDLYPYLGRPDLTTLMPQQTPEPPLPLFDRLLSEIGQPTPDALHVLGEYPKEPRDERKAICGQPTAYPDLGQVAPTVPMFDTAYAAVDFCADVIEAHTDLSPSDVVISINRLTDCLVARLTKRADQLRGQAEEMQSVINQLDSVRHRHD